MGDSLFCAFGTGKTIYDIMKKASLRPKGFMRPARLERKTQAKGMDKAARQNYGRKAGAVHVLRNEFIGGCMRSVE